MTGLEIFWLTSGVLVGVAIFVFGLYLFDVDDVLGFVVCFVGLAIGAFTIAGVLDARGSRMQTEQAERQIEEFYNVEVENISVDGEWVTWLNDKGEFCKAEMQKDHGRYLIVDGSTSCKAP